MTAGKPGCARTRRKGRTGQRSLATLREWGVRVLIDPARLPRAGAVPAAFPWDELGAELPALRQAVQGRSAG